MTSSIARVNCFLRGIEDFQIVRGDTLSEPKFVQGDRLMRFDVMPGQSALFHQAVGSRRLRLRPLGAQPLRHPAPGPSRLRLLAAHEPRRAPRAEGTPPHTAQIQAPHRSGVVRQSVWPHPPVLLSTALSDGRQCVAGKGKRILMTRGAISGFPLIEERCHFIRRQRAAKKPSVP